MSQAEPIEWALAEDEKTPVRLRYFHRDCGCAVWTGFVWVPARYVTSAEGNYFLNARWESAYFAAETGGEPINRCAVCGAALASAVLGELQMWQIRDEAWDQWVARGSFPNVGRGGLPAPLVAALYFDYCRGESLSDIGRIWGRTRQAVWDVFNGQKLPLREDSQGEHVVTWKGRKFAPGKNGYLRETRGDRPLLHQLVWEDAKGAIPAGFNVAFRDGNFFNVAIENLFLEEKLETLNRGRNKPGRRANQFDRRAA